MCPEDFLRIEKEGDESRYYLEPSTGKINEEPIFEVEECRLRGTVKQTGEKIEILMDKEQFDEWRIKMKNDG